jgi:hypothetical protein
VTREVGKMSVEAVGEGSDEERMMEWSTEEDGSQSKNRKRIK